MNPMFLVAVLSILCAGLSAHGQGRSVFVCDAGNFDAPPWRVLRVDPEGQNPEVFTEEGLAWPQDILFLEDQGVALVSNLNSGTINRHDIGSGDLLGPFATGLAGPTRMALGPDSLLYVLQWSGNGRVLRFQPDGTPLEDFSSQGVAQAIGLAWDGQGRLYVSSYSADRVYRYEADGSGRQVFIGTGLVGPTNLWFDDGGDLLVSDYDGGSVKRFSPDGSYEGVFIDGLGQCEGVAWLPDGTLLLGNGATSSVRKYNPDGQYLGDLLTPGSGGLLRPNAVVLGPVEVAVADRRQTAPAQGGITQTARPNPFNPATTLEFRLPGDGPVRITLHDLDGRLCRTLLSRWMPAGTHSLAIDGGDLPSGLYLSRITGLHQVSTARLLLLK